MSRRFALSLLAAIPLAVSVGHAGAAELNVVGAGAIEEPFEQLSADFGRESGHKVHAIFGPVGGMQAKLKGGEKADVIVLSAAAMDALDKDGSLVAGSRADLAKTGVGVVVKAGTSLPDIGSVDAFKRTLLAAKSVAYSDSASGVYVSTEMFAKLGIADAMKDKARKIPATPVGEIVAHGDAEIGFQQISELMPVKGIDIVGQLPAEVQKITIFSAGVSTTSKEPDAAKSLITFLASAQAAPVLIKAGLEPIQGGKS